MRFNKISLAAMVLGGGMLLSACGGDSSPAAVLSINGTAAKGAALVGTVTATCKSGTGTTTSNADGSFTVVVANGTGPCLLSITPTGGTPLYSITSGTGTTLTANITSMTNMLVSYLENVPGINTASTHEAWFALPATQALLADTTALNTRITTDFIPAVQALLPAGTTLNVNSSAFLTTAFAVGSSTDKDLDTLIAKSVVTATGSPTSATTAALATKAADDTKVVVPVVTGAAN